METAASTGFQGLRAGQPLPQPAWFQSSDPNTSALLGSICLSNQNVPTATVKPASARDRKSPW